MRITKKMRENLETFIENVQCWYEDNGYKIPSDETVSELLSRTIVINEAIDCARITKLSLTNI